MKNIRVGERVLVTGGTGSLGVALAEALRMAGAEVRVFSRDEKKQYEMSKRFPNCDYRLGDIRDPAACLDAVRDIDTVIHGASLKYVNIGEAQPYEYVTTNAVGSLAILNAVLMAGTVHRFVGISSDKACLPVNVYGMTKALLKRLTIEANDRQGSLGGTVFNVARYGNVVGTRGSVVPFWRECVAAGKPLPVTNPAMTRFFFTIDEAIDLIDASLAAAAGAVLSKRMNACSVMDLAEVMRGELPIEVVGERPGEKLHEMLLSDFEMSKTILRQPSDIFEYRPGGPLWADGGAYTSDVAPQLDREQIAKLLAETPADL
jgi:UDP-N-acetylglucosamine 4,6-dehydratase/5-epimerase